MKKFIKLCFTFAGVIILVSCITGEVDGIGRFAMILFGVIFCFIGSFIKSDK